MYRASIISLKSEAAMSELLNFDVGQQGGAPFLATRSKGREIREALEDQVAQSSPDEVVIDFAGVEAMTISFADEFIGRFFAALDTVDLRSPAVVATGLNEENLTTLSICLERRELAAAAIVDDHPVLIGAPDYLVETYRHALSLGTFSALDLAQRLDITPQNVNNRLKRLIDSAAIRRRRVVGGRGGKEFTYTAPSPCPHVT
jgi:hypothetical protein